MRGTVLLRFLRDAGCDAGAILSWWGMEILYLNKHYEGGSEPYTLYLRLIRRLPRVGVRLLALQSTEYAVRVLTQGAILDAPKLLHLVPRRSNALCLLTRPLCRHST